MFNIFSKSSLAGMLWFIALYEVFVCVASNFCTATYFSSIIGHSNFSLKSPFIVDVLCWFVKHYLWFYKEPHFDVLNLCASQCRIHDVGLKRGLYCTTVGKAMQYILPFPSISFVRISFTRKGKEGQSTRRIRTKEGRTACRYSFVWEGRMTVRSACSSLECRLLG
jgi:hypothetical protein